MEAYVSKATRKGRKHYAIISSQPNAFPFSNKQDAKRFIRKYGGTLQPYAAQTHPNTIYWTIRYGPGWVCDPLPQIRIYNKRTKNLDWTKITDTDHIEETSTSFIAHRENSRSLVIWSSYDAEQAQNFLKSRAKKDANWIAIRKIDPRKIKAI